MKQNLRLHASFIVFLLLPAFFYAFEELKTYPWLNTTYGFTETYDTNTSPITGKKAGCYPIGNGLVFGGLGAFDPVSSVNFICGPYYDEPFLGREELQCLIDGEKVKLHKQTIRWVKGADIIISSLINDKVEITNIDFAPPGIKALVRIFSVKNISGAPLKDLKLVFKYLILEKNVKTTLDGGKCFNAKFNGDIKKFYRSGFVYHSEKASLEKGNDYSVAFALNSNEEFSDIRYIAADLEESGLSKTAELIKKDGSKLLEPTKQYWDEWLASSTAFTTDNILVNYLIETQKMIIKCQQSHSGGFSPVYGYADTWARDNNGPVLLMLRSGRFKEVKQILDFFYKVARHAGFVAGCAGVTCALDETKNNESDFDWKLVGVPAAEIPSWIIKQYYWYYLYTGDIELIKERFPFLMRCLDGQSLTKTGRLPFQTDETYMWTLQNRTFKLLGYPNYYIGLRADSADSGFEWVAAAENMAEMAAAFKDVKTALELKKKAYEVRAATNKYYWMEEEGYYSPALSLFSDRYAMPHSNIGLNPLWVGYADEKDEKAVKSAKTTISYLLKDNFLMKTTPGVELFSGLVPGMLLYNLAILNDPLKEKAYEALLKCASPSGDYSELYYGDGSVWIVTSWGDGPYGRVRPWEGGVNIDALLFYLTGFKPGSDGVFKLSPELPSNMSKLEINGLLLNNSKIDFSVKEERGKDIKRIYEVKNLNLKSVKVSIDTNLVASTVKSFLVNQEDALKESGKIERELPGLGILKIEVLYEKAEMKTAITPKTFKKRWNYYPKSDIVYLTADDKNTYYSLAKNNKVLAIDIQLPLSAGDIYSAIYDEKNNTLKTKMVIFGPKVFSISNLHWKNYEFWNSWEMQNMFKKYTEAGGVVIFMSEPSQKEGYEVSPKWLEKLLDGGKWVANWKSGRAMASDDFTETTLKSYKMDSFNFYNKAQQKEKKAVVYSKLGKDGEGVAEKSVTDKKYSGYCEFELSVARGLQHSILIKAPSTVSSYDLNLEVRAKSGFVRLSQGKKNVKDKHLEINYILSSQYVDKDKITLRIGALKTKNKITFSLVEISKLIITGQNPLAEVMGFKAGEILENSIGSLTYEKMTAPIRLVENEKYAAIVMKKAGNGIVIRSQLKFSNLKPVIFNLINDESRGKILKYLAKSSKNENK